MNLAWIVLAGGALALWSRAKPFATPPPVLMGTPTPSGSTMDYVPGSTPVKWGAEIANAHANDIRYAEGWWLRSLQA